MRVCLGGGGGACVCVCVLGEWGGGGSGTLFWSHQMPDEFDNVKLRLAKELDTSQLRRHPYPE